MKPQLLHVGETRSAVIVVDDFTGRVEDIVKLADELAPFPPIDGNYYPGLRRAITRADTNAFDYGHDMCRRAAPLIGNAFRVNDFTVIEGSFSLVTLEPDELQPLQREPHFDSPEPTGFALLHYLRVPPGSGTAFYRHRATGIERVSKDNLDRLIATRNAESRSLPHRSGYMRGSDAVYEQIGLVEAVPDRLVIYQGSLLHSAVIPDDMNFSADPRQGRLTTNFFLQGR